MTPEQYRHVGELYHAVLALAPAARAAFLDESCGTDAMLRREVESLLRAHQHADGFIAEKVAGMAAAMSLQSQKTALVGQRFSHYQVLSLLGTGAMGEVYLAEDTSLGRKAALKLLPAKFTCDPERLRRFEREARAASALNHPNTLTIYEVGVVGETHFIATEYIDGQTLRERLHEGRLELGEALDYASQIASALAVAHEAGIIHRDIKPENVMVRRDGLVKVLDFGLAKLSEQALAEQPARVTVDSDSLQDKAQLSTAAGVVMGTVAYMSPEQARGQKVDQRTDIFSLGIMLYEMLAGRRPFAGATPSETIAAILRDEPPPLIRYTPGTPPALPRIVSQALCKERDERYQAVKDLMLDLKSVQQEISSPVISTPVEPETRRRPGWILLPLISLVVLLGAVGMLWKFRRGVPPAIGQPLPLTSFPGFELNPALSPDGRQVAFAWNGDRQNNFDIYIQLVGSSSKLQLTRHPAEELSPAWSPDGRNLAFLRRLDSTRNELLLIPALGGPERKLAETVILDERQLHFSALAWSPDGRWLVVSHREAEDQGEGLFLISTQTGEQRRLTRPPANYSRDFTPTFSPDGRALLISRVSGPARTAAIYLLSLSADYTPVGAARLLKTDEPFIASPVWTPDGRHVIYLAAASVGKREQTELRQLAVSGAGRSERVLLLEGEINELSLGRHLVYTQHNHEADIWRAEVPPAGQPPSQPQLFISSTRWDAKPLYSPDGKKIAFGTTRSGTWEIWLADADGANPQQLTFFGGPFVGFKGWSPDSQRLIFHARPEGQADLFTISSAGGAPQRLTTDPSDEVSPCYSHDGRWIYFASTRSGQLEVWKMPVEGGLPTKLTSVGGRHPIESRDGKTVYFAPLRREQGIWKVPVEGGAAAQVTGPLSGLFAFDVGAQGIFYAPATEAGQKNSIRFLSFATGQSRTVVISERPIDEDLAISPDQRFLTFVLHNQRDDDLILIENFVVR